MTDDPNTEQIANSTKANGADPSGFNGEPATVADAEARGKGEESHSTREAIQNALEGKPIKADAFPHPPLSDAQEQALFVGTGPEDKVERARRSRNKFDGHYGEADKTAEGLAKSRQHARDHKARGVTAAENALEEAALIERDVQPETKSTPRATFEEWWTKFSIFNATIYFSALLGLGTSTYVSIATFVERSALDPNTAEGGGAIFLMALLALSTPLIGHVYADALSDVKRERFIKRLWPIAIVSAATWGITLAYQNALTSGIGVILSETESGVMFYQATQAISLALMAVSNLALDIAGGILLWGGLESIHRSHTSVRLRESLKAIILRKLTFSRTAEKREADEVHYALMSVAYAYRNSREAFCDFVEAQYKVYLARREAAIARATSETYH